ncbi:hypothetical protein [Methylomicrobium lacus]|uniref:hypothetical protein n=1 Tax=Methylomicrobium lacus TaxID=136992 RepID=UPI0035A88BE0
MTLPKSELTLQRLQILKDFDDDIIDQLLHSVSTYTVQKHKTLANQAEEIQTITVQDGLDAEWLAALLDDDRTFLDEAHKLIYELATALLYKKIEITTRRVLAAVFPGIAAEPPLKLEKLNKYLRKQGLEVELLPNYEAINEVRHLYNDIKQGGIAGKKLAAYPGWEKGEALQNLDAAYKRLAPLCASYMKELIEMLMFHLSREPLNDETNEEEIDSGD